MKPQAAALCTDNLGYLAMMVWMMAIFLPFSLLIGAMWLLTLKTASVAGCCAVDSAESLVTSWATRLPREQDEEQTTACLDEVGTKIVELNTKRVPRLGEGWGVSIVWGMLGCMGTFVVQLPMLIGALKRADKPIEMLIFTSMAVCFGALPLVLLALPAAMTDKCIELETHLSDLLIPSDPSSDSPKDSRYVCSVEMSDKLKIVKAYMREQNSGQGLGFVIGGQLCSRRFSWQLFVLSAAVLTTGVGMLYEAIGVL